MRLCFVKTIINFLFVTICIEAQLVIFRAFFRLVVTIPLWWHGSQVAVLLDVSISFIIFQQYISHHFDLYRMEALKIYFNFQFMCSVYAVDLLTTKSYVELES